MKIQRITTEESEKKAKDLLAAVRRLEARHPKLRMINSGVSAVRQRFEAICELVTRSELDRRRSLIGGAPFLSQDYPNLDMAPLVQLNLDEISDATGEFVGSGLLQVWMPRGLWGQEPYLGDLHIRVVPRDVADNTAELLAPPEFEDAEWIERKAAELEVLKIVDPSRAEKNEEIYHAHYRSGLNGFDWTLSEFSDCDDCYSPGNLGAPQQIVDWQPAGFTIPPTGDHGMWDWDEDDFERNFPRLYNDPDYKTVCKILGARLAHPRCALFDVYYDFAMTVYGSEIYYGDDAVGWDWRPLFAFPGPLSDVVADEHVVFYRESDGKFEYAGASMRWNWH